MLEIIGDVAGKNALIVDDFTNTAGTLVELAKEMKRRGAQRIIACVSHVLLREDGVKKVEESPIELLIGTDSVDNSWLAASPRIKMISVAPLFAEAIRRIHARESVSPLFASVPGSVVDRSIADCAGDDPA